MNKNDPKNEDIEYVDPADIAYVEYMGESGEAMSFDEYIDRLNEGDL